MNILSKITLFLAFMAVSVLAASSSNSMDVSDFERILRQFDQDFITTEHEFTEEELEEFMEHNKNGTILSYTDSTDEESNDEESSNVSDIPLSPMNFSYDVSHNEDTKDDATSTSTTEQETVTSTAKKTKKKVSMSQEPNTYCEYKPYIPPQKPIMDPVASIDQPAITELNTSDILTITLRSTKTSTNYVLQDIIGKNIHEYVRLLKRNNALQGEDRTRYNFGGPISYHPSLPQDILSTLGITDVTGKTVITRDVAKQLSIQKSVLSFSFDSQTGILSTTNSSIFLRSSQEIDEDRRLERSRIESFMRSTKRPSDKIMQSPHTLHTGYVLKKRDGQTKAYSEWEKRS